MGGLFATFFYSVGGVMWFWDLAWFEICCVLCEYAHQLFDISLFLNNEHMLVGQWTQIDEFRFHDSPSSSATTILPGWWTWQLFRKMGCSLWLFATQNQKSFWSRGASVKLA